MCVLGFEWGGGGVKGGGVGGGGSPAGAGEGGGTRTNANERESHSDHVASPAKVFKAESRVKGEFAPCLRVLIAPDLTVI